MLKNCHMYHFREQNWHLFSPVKYQPKPSHLFETENPCSTGKNMQIWRHIYSKSSQLSNLLCVGRQEISSDSRRSSFHWKDLHRCQHTESDQVQPTLSDELPHMSACRNEIQYLHICTHHRQLTAIIQVNVVRWLLVWFSRCHCWCPPGKHSHLISLLLHFI